MEINKHIGFTTKKIPELFLYLSAHRITFKESSGCCVFDILESNPHWETIAHYVKKYQLPCLSSTIFTKEEMRSVQWLRVRSKWQNGYPQPENRFAYELITYSTEKHCVECGAGLQQKDAFRTKKTPNWGRRHFMMLNWVEDELFLDDSAKKVLDTSGLSGIAFAKVKNKQGLEFLPNVNQLVVENILPAGLRVDCRAINATYLCQECGAPKYHPSGEGMYEFNKASFENAPDIVKTSEWFGWGHAASRLIIVSQKMYQLITQNNLDRGLVFEPVLLL